MLYTAILLEDATKVKVLQSRVHRSHFGISTQIMVMSVVLIVID